MTNRNLPTLTAIATDPAVLTQLTLDGLDALLGEIDAQTKVAAAAKKAVVACLESRYGDAIKAAFDHQQKDFGTVHIADGAWGLEVNVAKKVEWDQDQLQAIGDKIVEAGDNPREFITTELKVDERKFTAWPESIRKAFEPARTVKPGALTIKLSQKRAA